MAFEDMNMEDLEPESGETPPPEESGNRTFMIAVGVLGGIAVLALICIVLYALVLRPQQLAQRQNQIATLNAQNTAVAQALTATYVAAAATATPTPTVTPVPSTSTPTPTSVVAVPTDTQIPTEDPRTATVAALLTQAAITTQTVVPTTTSTALPTTGFAEDLGLPMMLGLAALLIVVIFVARRLRTV